MSAVVLIVDDDEDSRITLREVIEESGDYVTITATDGRDALHKLEVGPKPDVILLDVLMPFMNGFDFMAELHRDERFSAIHVVMLSGADVKREPPYGAKLLRKPLDIDELMKWIGEALRNH